MRPSLARKILKQLENKPEAHVFRPIDFLDLGLRPAVDKALSRLTRNREIFRFDHGFYVKGQQTSFGLRLPFHPQHPARQVAQNPDPGNEI